MSFDFHGIIGFDFSTHNDSPDVPGDVDFQKAKAYGARFVILRASNGKTPDSDFAVNWRNVKGVLPRSVYHYFNNYVDPRVQAQCLWDVIKNDPDGRVWFDLEDRNPGVYAGWDAWYNCIEEFQRLSGYGDDRIGIYTGFYYWTEQTTHATNAQKAYFGRFPLWLAWYFPDDPFHPVYITVRIPYPWDKVDILQCGTPAIGHLIGTESLEVDYNQLNGGEAELNKLFCISDTVSEPPQEEPMLYKLTALIGLNIRTDAGTQFPVKVSSGIRTGDVIESGARKAASDGVLWYRIDKQTGAGVNITAGLGGWASSGATGKYLRLDNTETPAVYPVKGTFLMSNGETWETGVFTKK